MHSRTGKRSHLPVAPSGKIDACFDPSKRAPNFVLIFSCCSFLICSIRFCTRENISSWNWESPFIIRIFNFLTTSRAPASGATTAALIPEALPKCPRHGLATPLFTAQTTAAIATAAHGILIATSRLPPLRNRKCSIAKSNIRMCAAPCLQMRRRGPFACTIASPHLPPTMLDSQRQTLCLTPPQLLLPHRLFRQSLL